MKNLVFCGVLSAVLSNAVLADQFSGARIGGGYSETEIETDTLDADYGDGFKAEYGYDFNKFIGADLSYETNSSEINGQSFDGESIKLGGNLGYAFSFSENSVFLKPYIKLGVHRYSEESDGAEFDDRSLYYGLGLRFQLSHFYTDISLDKSEVNSDTINADLIKTALTIGYKF